MRLLTGLVLPAVLFLSACGASQTAPAPAAEAGTASPAPPAEAAAVSVEVRDAFIVQPPEGRDVTGGGLYASVSGGSLTLIGATTPAAASVELHTMSMENDMMQMRKVDSLPLTPDLPLVLERGGNHLMFFGLGPIEAGSQVDLSLTFTDGSGTEIRVDTKAEVVPPAG
ncbi:MAG: copper chaperone PCu(A)C [Hyphomonas sp.]